MDEVGEHADEDRPRLDRREIAGMPRRAGLEPFEYVATAALVEDRANRRTRR